MLTLAELENEDILPLKELRKHAVFRSAAGKPAHPSVIHRYFSIGVVGKSGERVRLEYAQTPRGRVTTRQALARFLDALAGRSTPQDRPVPPKWRSRQSEKANEELAASGW